MAVIRIVLLWFKSHLSRLGHLPYPAKHQSVILVCASLKTGLRLLPTSHCLLAPLLDSCLLAKSELGPIRAAFGVQVRTQSCSTKSGLNLATAGIGTDISSRASMAAKLIALDAEQNSCVVQVFPV